MLVLKITNRCPVECAHCRENATHDSAEVMTKEIIDKALSNIDSSWVVCLQGGEAILEHELCEYAMSIIKQKGACSNLYTSGFWWDRIDEEVEWIEKLDPTILVISVNDWTQEKVPIEKVNEIASRFVNNKPVLLYSECYLDKPKWFDRLEYKSCYVPYEIAPVGRAKNLENVYKSKVWIPKSICVLSGFSVDCDGTITGNCCAATRGCVFGNVFENQLSEFMNERKRVCGGYKNDK